MIDINNKNIYFTFLIFTFSDSEANLERDLKIKSFFKMN